MFLHTDNEDSDQTGRMPRLIWVFAGHTGHFVGFVMRQIDDLDSTWIFVTKHLMPVLKKILLHNCIEANL